MASVLPFAITKVSLLFVCAYYVFNSPNKNEYLAYAIIANIVQASLYVVSKDRLNACGGIILCVVLPWICATNHFICFLVWTIAYLYWNVAFVFINFGQIAGVYSCLLDNFLPIILMSISHEFIFTWAFARMCCIICSTFWHRFHIIYDKCQLTYEVDVRLHSYNTWCGALHANFNHAIMNTSCQKSNKQLSST